MQLVHAAEFRLARGPLNVHDVRFEDCTFDNCSGRSGVVRNVEVSNATSWSCNLHDVIIEDCVVDGVKTSFGGGGRTQPFFLWGALAHRLVVRGTFGGLIWNPPWRSASEPPAADPFAVARRYYAEMDDWAIDLREARFRSVPGFRYGPPGHLVRRDEETQPLVDVAQAERALRTDADLGVWRVVLDGFVRAGWPASTVLVPPAGASKRKYDESLAAAARVRAAAGIR